MTETMDTYGHLFPDAEDLGRGAIDAIFAVALTEQGLNQETPMTVPSQVSGRIRGEPACRPGPVQASL
jgi:hypothetical protein